jgi:branched-chain amino acid transport system substrate-binding protein
VRFSRRLSASLSAVTMLATMAAGCDAGEPGEPAEIVIGADLELSGPGQTVGTAYKQALELKVEQLNASGLLGRRRLALKFADNHSDPTSAQRNLGVFADDPTVAAAIAGRCSECVVGAAKAINEKQLPTIALAPAGQVSSPVGDRRYLFKLGPNAADSAAAIVAELKRRSTKTVALLFADDLYGNGGDAAMRAELTKADITLTGAATVKPNDGLVDGTVRDLTKKKPDALVVWAFADQAVAAATAANRVGFDGAVYFDAAAASEMFLPPEATKATNAVTMAFTQILAIDDVIATTPAKAARKQWYRDYTSRYGNYSGMAAFAADALDLIARAVARAGGDRGRIREVLETSQMDGLSGPIRLTPDNHSGLMPQAMTLLVARNGRWRLLT